MTDVLSTANCEREPIHIPGSVQAYGVLLAFQLATLEIAFISANAASVFSCAPEAMLGAPLATHLAPDLIHDIGNALQASSASGAPERVGPVDIGPDALACSIAVHIVGGLAICEFTSESATRSTRDPSVLVRAVLGRLKRAPRLDRFLNASAQQVRAVTGYDRVMIYRFRHDQSGVVVAEAVRVGLPPYMGLHYPASDIPAQARALLKRQALRQIPDVDYAPAPILPMAAASSLDLSLSTLRSVSPIHLQYLRNMGSAATLTVSIMRGDELWGLIACHHETPRRLPGATCAALEMFAQVFSFQLEAREQAEELAEVARTRGAHEALLAELASDAPLFDNLTQFAARVRALIVCEGVGVWSGGRFSLDGAGPPASAIPQLIRHFAASGERVWTSDHLSATLPDATRYATDASGLLAIPLGGASTDYLLLFRAEQLRDVVWGGDPRKAVEPTGDGAHIGPRRSFAAWREVTRGRSAPWRPADLQVANMLRVSLLDAIVRKTKIADEARRETHESQALLVAELNHRVKNIFALTRSLMRQSRASAVDLDDFAQTVDLRLSALARAHDQSSQVNWASASLRRLLEVEARAWSNISNERVKLEGPEVLLSRRALQALSLVAHELMTNAAKYGAMSNDVGVLTISWRRDENGVLTIAWRESGGPPVAAPTRRGFGTTVIEQTLGFELGGSADVRYGQDGLQADFVVPGEFVRDGDPVEAPSATVFRAPPDLNGRRVLVVEDSMMIALDTQAILERFGAEVEIAANTPDARKALASGRFAGAVLDVNLYGETSFAIADELQTVGVPFLFASGFGDRAPLPDRFKSIIVMGKPFDGVELASHLVAMQGRA